MRNLQAMRHWVTCRGYVRQPTKGGICQRWRRSLYFRRSCCACARPAAAATCACRAHTHTGPRRASRSPWCLGSPPPWAWRCSASSSASSSCECSFIPRGDLDIASDTAVTPLPMHPFRTRQLIFSFNSDLSKLPSSALVFLSPNYLLNDYSFLRLPMNFTLSDEIDLFLYYEILSWRSVHSKVKWKSFFFV